MAATISSAALPAQIQKLLDQKAEHSAAISKIEKTLAGVTAALGGSVTPVAVTKTAPAAVKTPVVKGKKRTRTKFAVSTNDVILSFVRARKTPTSKEITQHLLTEGRTSSVASNALSMLTAAAKKLKRTPLGKGMLGSTYSLP